MTGASKHHQITKDQHRAQAPGPGRSAFAGLPRRDWMVKLNHPPFFASTGGKFCLNSRVDRSEKPPEALMISTPKQNTPEPNRQSWTSPCEPLAKQN